MTCRDGDEDAWCGGWELREGFQTKVGWRGFDKTEKEIDEKDNQENVHEVILAEFCGRRYGDLGKSSLKHPG